MNLHEQPEVYSEPPDPEDHYEFEDREEVRAMGRMMDDEPQDY